MKAQLVTRRSSATALEAGVLCPPFGLLLLPIVAAAMALPSVGVIANVLRCAL
ncbi:MAG: hypothetical protein KF892_03980 [Rhizobacter sp.]|nr:hypothetical protein [Rhizobacter sp.]